MGDSVESLAEAEVDNIHCCLRSLTLEYILFPFSKINFLIWGNFNAVYVRNYHPDCLWHIFKNYMENFLLMYFSLMIVRWIQILFKTLKWLCDLQDFRFHL